MAASKWQVYNEAKTYILNGTIDLDTSAIRMKLVKGTGSAAVSDYTRSTFASCGTAVTVSGNTTVRTPGSLAIISINASTKAFDSADVVFTMSGEKTSLRYLVIGVSGGKAIAWSKLSADTTVQAAQTLTVTINANGYFTLSGGTTA